MNYKLGPEDHREWLGQDKLTLGSMYMLHAEANHD